VRKLLSYLPLSNAERPPFVPTADDLERADVELQTIVPESPNKPYDMREVVSRILDGREFFEVQPFFAPNIVVASAGSAATWWASSATTEGAGGRDRHQRLGQSGAVHSLLRRIRHSDHLLRRCAGYLPGATRSTAASFATGEAASMRTPRRPSPSSP